MSWGGHKLIVTEYHLHEYILSLWGMPLGEMLDLEKLAQICRQKNRWTFFFTSAPANVPGELLSSSLTPAYTHQNPQQVVSVLTSTVPLYSSRIGVRRVKRSGMISLLSHISLSSPDNQNIYMSLFTSCHRQSHTHCELLLPLHHPKLAVHLAEKPQLPTYSHLSYIFPWRFSTPSLIILFPENPAHCPRHELDRASKSSPHICRHRTCRSPVIPTLPRPT